MQPIRDKAGKFESVKPCDCGCTDLKIRYAVHDGEPYQSQAACEKCGLLGPMVHTADEIEAIRAWNRSV